MNCSDPVETAWRRMATEQRPLRQSEMEVRGLARMAPMTAPRKEPTIPLYARFAPPSIPDVFTPSNPSNFPNTASAVNPATNPTPNANGIDLRAYASMPLVTRSGLAVNCAVMNRTPATPPATSPTATVARTAGDRSEEHTSELQSLRHL